MSRYLIAAIALCFALSASAQNVRFFPPANQAVTLCQSAVAVPITGTTNETAGATCNIPAGAMGPNGRLRITAIYTATSSANNKTVRARFSGAGGSSYGAAVFTTQSGTYYLGVEIANRNATNSQVGQQGGSALTGTITTSAVDTTAATSVVLTCQLALSTETCTLESYSIVLMPGS